MQIIRLPLLYVRVGFGWFVYLKVQSIGEAGSWGGALVCVS